MIPTPEEVAAELAKLRDLAPRIQQRSFFNGDNRAKIDAQIAILSGEKTIEYYEFDDSDDNEDFDESERELWDAANAAHTWMVSGTLEFGNSLSEDWEPLVIDDKAN